MQPNDELTQTTKSYLAWEPLATNITQQLATLAQTHEAAVLALWANRGGGKTTSLRWLANHLDEQPQIEVAGSWDVRAISLQELIADIFARVKHIAQNAQAVVLLDNVDAWLMTDGDLFINLEQEIVQPLVLRFNVTIIVTSQMPHLEWLDYQIRERQTTLHIPPLAPDDVAVMLGTNNALAAHTLGYPQAVHWARSEPSLTVEQFDHKVDKFFCEGFDDKTADLARVTALLPLFNVLLLRLLRTDDSASTESLYADYLKRIRELAGAGLIVWDPDPMLYRFADGTVRRLLANSFERDRPTAYERIQDIAARYFKEEARRPAYLQYSFVSALYHLAQALRAGGSTQVDVDCVQWLNDSLRDWADVDWTAIQATWQSGANDPVLVQEFQALLQDSTFQYINRLFKPTAQSVEAIA